MKNGQILIKRCLCKVSTIFFAKYELCNRSHYDSILFYCLWTWSFCFLSLSEMACLTLKVSGQSTPVEHACKKNLRNWGFYGFPFSLAFTFTVAICCSSAKSSWFVLIHLFYQIAKGASGWDKRECKCCSF